jgi:hypothetical protein
MSSLLRSASLKARSIAEAGVRAGARCSFAQPRVLVRFSTSEGPINGRMGDGVNRDFRTKAIPQPLPAVAYDYDWGDNDGETNDTVSLTASKCQDGMTLASGQEIKKNVTPDVDPIIVSLVAGRNPPSGTNKSYSSPSSMDRNGKPIQLHQKTGGGGGGGGGGRHRCPKCGTYTIFSHTEFDNSLYCATCSGWFTAAETLKGDENMIKVGEQ